MPPLVTFKWELKDRWTLFLKDIPKQMHEYWVKCCPSLAKTMGFHIWSKFQESISNRPISDEWREKKARMIGMIVPWGRGAVVSIDNLRMTNALFDVMRRMGSGQPETIYVTFIGTGWKFSFPGFDGVEYVWYHEFGFGRVPGRFFITDGIMEANDEIVGILCAPIGAIRNEFKLRSKKIIPMSVTSGVE